MAANVTFHFKDGTVRKTLKGYTVPYNESTKALYDLINGYKESSTKKDKTA